MQSDPLNFKNDYRDKTFKLNKNRHGINRKWNDLILSNV